MYSVRRVILGWPALYTTVDSPLLFATKLFHSKIFFAMISKHGPLESCDMVQNTCEPTKRPLLKRERSVTFTNIEVREYPICISDNPGAARGIPIAIGWEHKECNNFSVDEYECLVQTRPAGGVDVISPKDRFHLLLKSKLYSNKEIMTQMRRVEIDRERREETVRNLDKEQQHLRVENMKRALLNATIRRSAKKQERKFLKGFKPKASSNSSIDTESTTELTTTEEISCDSSNCEEESTVSLSIPIIDSTAMLENKL